MSAIQAPRTRRLANISAYPNPMQKLDDVSMGSFCDVLGVTLPWVMEAHRYFRRKDGAGTNELCCWSIDNTTLIPSSLR
jgi:hypothetical protein